MILRLWRGWTEGEGTAAYRELLTDEIAPAIVARGISGLQGMTVLQRHPQDLPAGPVETATLMLFDDMAAVAEFTGGEPTGSVVPPAARRLLTRFDAHSVHYEPLATFGHTPFG
jgi:hypothetical protein